jgi:hypothetical protein
MCFRGSLLYFSASDLFLAARCDWVHSLELVQLSSWQFEPQIIQGNRKLYANKGILLFEYEKLQLEREKSLRGEIDGWQNVTIISSSSNRRGLVRGVVKLFREIWWVFGMKRKCLRSTLWVVTISNVCRGFDKQFHDNDLHLLNKPTPFAFASGKRRGPERKNYLENPIWLIALRAIHILLNFYSMASDKSPHTNFPCAWYFVFAWKPVQQTRRI